MTPAKMAEQLLDSRRLRNATFRQHLDGLGEPVWDMLLLLFVAWSERATVHVDDLVAVTATDDEIARPYILWLESRSLVEVAFDRVGLASEGRSLMTAYLEQEIEGQ